MSRRVRAWAWSRVGRVLYITSCVAGWLHLERASYRLAFWSFCCFVRVWMVRNGY